MPLTRRAGSEAPAGKVDWADPGYFSGNSVVGNTVRVLVQLIHPPRGHRTVPTKTGILLIVVTIGVGTAAFNTGQNILYLALSLLLSTLLVSGILSWMNFKGCRWRLEAGRHFRAGEPSPVRLEVENTKRRLPSYDLTFRLSAERSEAGEDLVLGKRLAPGERASLVWEFTPARRGLETIRLDGLLSCYPFGFLRKSIRDSFKREVSVWPARLPYQFGADRAGRRWLYGQHRRRGDGVELVHLRDYRHGDSLKRIHWKATARMRRLQVRETEQEHHQAFALHVDPSPNLWADPAQFERMCSFAASLAEDLYQRDQLRAARIAGEPPVTVGCIEDLHTFLDMLARLERRRPGRGSAAEATQADTVGFLPGPNGAVLARLGERHVGEA